MKRNEGAVLCCFASASNAVIATAVIMFAKLAGPKGCTSIIGSRRLTAHLSADYPGMAESDQIKEKEKLTKDGERTVSSALVAHFTPLRRLASGVAALV
jgi:hypothetical protein